MLPPGVEAEVTYAEQISWRELSRFRFAREAPELANAMMKRSRISFRVVKSSNPKSEVGTTAQMVVNTEVATFDELKQRVAECKGELLTLLQKIFKFFGMQVRGRCGAIDNSRSLPK